MRPSAGSSPFTVSSLSSPPRPQARRVMTTCAATRVTSEPPVPLPADARLLANAEIWNLTTRYGNLDITTHPSGTDGYDDLHRNADPQLVATGLRIEVATLEDVIRSKTAAGRAKGPRRPPPAACGARAPARRRGRLNQPVGRIAGARLAELPKVFQSCGSRRKNGAGLQMV